MFIREMSKGALATAEAHRIIVHHRLWSYFIMPGIMSLAYIVFAIAIVNAFIPDLNAYIMEHWIPGFLTGKIMAGVTWIALWLAVLLIILMSCKHVILIVFSPLLSRLSEITEQIVYHHPVAPWNTRQFLKDIIRSLRINIRIIVYSIIFSLPAWLLVFIPIVGTIVSPVLLFIIQSYYSGFGFVDYTLERKMFSVPDSVAFVKAHRSRVTGVGLPFTALMLIPVVGWFLAPAYATVSATLISLEIIYPEQAPDFSHRKIRFSST